MFFVMDYEQFELTSAEDLKNIFNCSHIVITDLPQRRRINFDRRGLENLGGWKQTRTIQGKL
jgi:hypothetical protein